MIYFTTLPKSEPLVPTQPKMTEKKPVAPTSDTPTVINKNSETPPSNPPERSRTVQRNPIIRGVEVTAEQWKTLQEGGHIYLESMNKRDGKGTFSSYVFIDLELKETFFSSQKPDEWVKYGKYEMRLMDKMRLEKGYLTRAKVKYYGIRSFAHPYLWPADKDKPGDYQESWSDPRKRPAETTRGGTKTTRAIPKTTSRTTGFSASAPNRPSSEKEQRS